MPLPMAARSTLNGLHRGSALQAYRTAASPTRRPDAGHFARGAWPVMHLQASTMSNLIAPCMRTTPDIGAAAGRPSPRADLPGGPKGGSPAAPYYCQHPSRCQMAEWRYGRSPRCRRCMSASLLQRSVPAEPRYQRTAAGHAWRYYDSLRFNFGGNAW